MAQTALDVFLSRKAEIDDMIERLRALSDDHFDTNPDHVNWGHVGSISRYADLLKQITTMARI